APADPPAGSSPAASRARTGSCDGIRFSAGSCKPVLTAIFGGEAQDVLVTGDECTRKLDRADNQEPIGGIAVLELDTGDSFASSRLSSRSAIWVSRSSLSVTARFHDP